MNPALILPAFGGFLIVIGLWSLSRLTAYTGQHRVTRGEPSTAQAVARATVVKAVGVVRLSDWGTPVYLDEWRSELVGAAT